MAITKGNLVKIRRNGERFWVEVLHEHDQPGIFSGRVNNYLIANPEKFGDEIQFSRDEVIEVFSQDQFRDVFVGKEES